MPFFDLDPDNRGLESQKDDHGDADKEPVFDQIFLHEPSIFHRGAIRNRLQCGGNVVRIFRVRFWSLLRYRTAMIPDDAKRAGWISRPFDFIRRHSRTETFGWFTPNVSGGRQAVSGAFREDGRRTGRNAARCPPPRPSRRKGRHGRALSGPSGKRQVP